MLALPGVQEKIESVMDRQKPGADQCQGKSLGKTQSREVPDFRAGLPQAQPGR